MRGLSGALRAFERREPYTVTRKGASTYTAGRLDEAAGETFETKAVVQPLTPREVQRLPEGLHGRETRVVYSRVELIAGSETTEGDRIDIDGDAYSVEGVEPWGEYWRAIVAKVRTHAA